MAKLFGGRKARLVLDVGTHAVRLCELTQTKAGYQITAYYQREFGIEPDMEEEKQRELRLKTLQELLKEAKGKGRTRKCIFGVPGQTVFTRTRQLPPVPEHKVTPIVRYEIQQQIPFSLDQIALSYQVLNRTDVGGYEVLMAAIKVDVVEKQMDLLAAAKRTASTVDVCPLAAYNWLKHTGEFGDEGDCVAMVDLGASTTDIVIERDGQFRFMRSLSMGGNDITQAIASEFGMTFREAEKLKRERGFAPTGDPSRDGKGGEVIGRVLDRLSSDIARSISYFRSQPGGGNVSRVIICGGGACMRNIVPYLQRKLNVEVRIAQPLSGVTVAPAAQEAHDHPEQAACALGMALRVQQPVTIEVDLIPPRVLELARSNEQAFYWALSLVTLALIIASIVPVQANQNQVYVEAIRRLEQVVKRYDASLLQPPLSASKQSEHERELQQAKNQVTGFQDQLAQLDQIRQNQRYWLDALNAVNDSRPLAGIVAFSLFETVRLDPPQQGNQGGGGRFGGRGGGNQNNAAFQATGFPGIAPTRGAAGGGGRFGRPGGGGQDAGVQEPPYFNGLLLQGFAETPEALQEFLERLRADNRFCEVHFNDAESDPVSWREMENAPTGGGGRALGPAQEGGRSAFAGGGASRLRGNAGPSASYQGAYQSSTQMMVTPFRIHLVYKAEGCGEELPPAGATEAR